MLAPLDTPPNPSTPGSSSDSLLHSQSISSRAPQEAYYQLDDNSRASALVAASPQHVDGNAVPPTYTADSSPYRTPSTVRSPHSQSTEYSPSASHPQAYSPALSSNYIPPPSPTPSQLHAYPVPGGQQYQHQHQQNMYQDPYQQTYQQTYKQHQPYPEPTLHAYPEPELVDAIDEKYRPSSAGSVTKPTKGRRKKIIWVGVIVIHILIAAIIGIVIMKNKDSNDNGNSSAGSNSSSPTPTTATTTFSRSPVSLIPVTVPGPSTTVSLIPVTVPTAAPTSGSGSGSGGSGGRYDAPPLTSLPPKGDCPFTFCGDYYGNCRNSVCSNDSDYKSCMSDCAGDAACGLKCLRSNPCMMGCSDNFSTCNAHCRK